MANADLTGTESVSTKGGHSGYVVGIDTGGTFTDIVVLHPDGQLTIDKSPTTPKNFSQGVIDAVAVAARSLGVDSRQFLEVRPCSSMARPSRPMP